MVEGDTDEFIYHWRCESLEVIKQEGGLFLLKFFKVYFYKSSSSLKSQ